MNMTNVQKILNKVQSSRIVYTKKSSFDSINLMPRNIPITIEKKLSSDMGTSIPFTHEKAPTAVLITASI